MPLPQNVQRDVLGLVLNDLASMEQFEAEDFTGENRTIFLRILDVSGRGERVDSSAVANELMKHDELEKCGGLTYLVELSK